MEDIHDGGGGRVGLVLGAGGVLGQAYHAGVLTALEQELGWDARSADVVVGTSAGAITGALVRCGIPASDLAAWAQRAPLSVEGQMLVELFGEEFPELEPIRPGDLLRRPRIPTRELLTRALLRPWQFRPVAAGTALVAPGRLDIVAHLAPLERVEGSAWPDRDLWICTVRRRDGRRVVFGRPGAPDAPLHLAVAASCAIPGYFAPVRIGERAYVDGGAHSPTNAAVLRERSVDLAVVVSPMSGSGSLPAGIGGLLRRHAKHRLARELGALERAGVPSLVFEPTPASQRAMGDDLLSRTRAEDVIVEAMRETTEAIHDRGASWLGLSGRSSSGDSTVA
jgi:NTE family protein